MNKKICTQQCLIRIIWQDADLISVIIVSNDACYRRRGNLTTGHYMEARAHNTTLELPTPNTDYIYNIKITLHYKINIYKLFVQISYIYIKVLIFLLCRPSVKLYQRNSLNVFFNTFKLCGSRIWQNSS